MSASQSKHRRIGPCTSRNGSKMTAQMSSQRTLTLTRLERHAGPGGSTCNPLRVGRPNKGATAPFRWTIGPRVYVNPPSAGFIWSWWHSCGGGCSCLIHALGCTRCKIGRRWWMTLRGQLNPGHTLRHQKRAQARASKTIRPTEQTKTKMPKLNRAIVRARRVEGNPTLLLTASARDPRRAQQQQLRASAENSICKRHFVLQRNRLYVLKHPGHLHVCMCAKKIATSRAHIGQIWQGRRACPANQAK